MTVARVTIMVNTRGPKGPLYDLNAIREAASSEASFALTRGARRDAENLGYSPDDVRGIVGRLQPSDYDHVWTKNDERGRPVLDADGEPIRMDVYLPTARNSEGRSDKIYLKVLLNKQLQPVAVVSVQSFHQPRKPV
ncbi:hypothetical protein thsps21_12970 [Pseudomonas sp. No.21]|uniref:type II toxin-antitoxin system MqsR family toxin n=1 Tax=Pseudomonas tohonis TaxID=2725477 RepID=UPI001F3F1ADF|nr:type II toxin-antitoxin system MqsR family toxin [Pseudomonas tohonis]GJN44915.1 hypothetical protein TUM20249_09010 [Pseudomonas tohonis]